MNTESTFACQPGIYRTIYAWEYQGYIVQRSYNKLVPRKAPFLFFFNYTFWITITEWRTLNEPRTPYPAIYKTKESALELVKMLNEANIL